MTADDRRPTYWAEQTLDQSAPRAHGDLRADVIVVGGGITGLSVADRLRTAGRSVILLEADRCGSGATGRSSGFVTPDSELELSELVRRFGVPDAALLWQNACEACASIRADAERGASRCDLIDADSLYVASSRRGVRAITAEHEARQRLGFPSRLYEGEPLAGLLGGAQYRAGVRAGGTLGINGLAWAQSQKRELASHGVRIFEESRVLRFEAEAVYTPDAIVRAPAIVFCLDRFAPEIAVAARDGYHAQASLTVTEPLTPATLRSIFPAGPLMVWDTDLVYKYFRPTAEGRLLVGGGSLRDTYAATETPGQRTFAMLEQYATSRFPQLRGVRFTHAWRGMIGMTRDLLPLAGRSPSTPSHYYALCAAGLAWSVLSARTAAAAVLGETTPLDAFFSPGRRFELDALPSIIGKGAAWALSYYYARNVQRSPRPRPVVELEPSSPMGERRSR